MAVRAVREMVPVVPEPVETPAWVRLGSRSAAKSRTLPRSLRTWERHRGAELNGVERRPGISRPSGEARGDAGLAIHDAFERRSLPKIAEKSTCRARFSYGLAKSAH
jgi:hypothetical protein